MIVFEYSNFIKQLKQTTKLFIYLYSYIFFLYKTGNKNIYSKIKNTN